MTCVCVWGGGSGLGEDMGDIEEIPCMFIAYQGSVE